MAILPPTTSSAAALTLALLLAALCQGALAQTPEPPKPAQTSPQTLLPADPEHFESILLPHLRQTWTTRVHKEIALLAQKLSLPPEVVDPLTRAIPEALETHLRSLPRAWPESLGIALEEDPALLSGELKNAFLDCATRLLTPASFFLHPHRDTPWETLLVSSLNPEQSAQLAQLQIELSSDTRLLARELGGSARRLLKVSLEREIHRLELALHLPPERADKLRALLPESESALDAPLRNDLQVALCRRHLQTQMDSSLLGPDDNDPAVLVPLEADTTPETLAAWDALLQTVLSPGELRKLVAHRTLRRLNTQNATCKLLVLAIDNACRVSTPQRAALEPLLLQSAVPSALGGRSLDGGEEMSNMIPLIRSLTGIPDSQIAPLLDSFQLALWQNAFAAPEGPALALDPGWIGFRKPLQKSTIQDQALGALPPLEQREAALSDHLYALLTHKRAQLQAELLPVAHELLTVAQIPPTQTSRFLAAAYGSIETKLRAWSVATETSLRQRLQNTPPEKTAEFLHSIREDYFLTGDPDESPPVTQSPLWKKILETELAPDALARWKQAQTERAQFEKELLLLLELRRLAPLTDLQPAQINALRSALLQTLENYLPDLEATLSGSIGDFYSLALEGDIRGVLWSFVPDDTLQKILSPSQIQAFRKTTHIEGGEDVVKEIQAAHKRRTSPAPQN